VGFVFLNRVDVMAGGANYLNGSFYGMSSVGVAVFGRVFTNSAGVIEEVCHQAYA
jgi:hypothetical protein